MHQALLLLAPLALTLMADGATAQNRYFDRGKSGIAVSAVRARTHDERVWGATAGLSWNGRLALIADWREDWDLGEDYKSVGVEAALIRIPYFMLEVGYLRGKKPSSSKSVAMVPVRAAVPIELGESLVLTPHITLTTYSADNTTIWGTLAGLDLRIKGLVLVALEHDFAEDPIEVSQSAVRVGLTLGF